MKKAVFPSKCIVCGSFFHVFYEKDSVHPINYTDKKYEMENITFERVMSPFLCASCLVDYLPVESPICSLCGVVFKSREGEDHLCQKCIEHPKHFGKARAIFLYCKAVMEVIHSFKYKGKLQVAGSLELLLFSVLIRHWSLTDFDLVVPVPLHIKRFRARGFNQAYILVKNLNKLAEKFMVKPGSIEIGRDVLQRTKWTMPQTGLGREERTKNIKGAFTVKDLFKVKGKRILLVDDVYTTGATVDECAKVLIDGGAKSVDVLTLARAI
ncbi:MAG: ComF family protein [Proteobacteria bacterium]|nr:ComF family protein [Pseudomonadota bacterium]MBU4035827.1 ComF family protein [Pseudomonadota bacterium]